MPSSSRKRGEACFPCSYFQREGEGIRLPFREDGRALRSAFLFYEQRREYCPMLRRREWGLLSEKTGEPCPPPSSSRKRGESCSLFCSFQREGEGMGRPFREDVRALASASLFYKERRESRSLLSSWRRSMDRLSEKMREPCPLPSSFRKRGESIALR